MNIPALINANAVHIPLADESVQLVCTSPPYFNLRAYSTGNNKDHEIGAESLHDCLGWATGSPCGFCYICSLVTVFREVKRILRKDGLLFLNLGDSYAGSSGAGGDYAAGGLREGQPKWKNGTHSLPAKNLYMIPARAALALQADGWILRSDLIWSKPNPMPQSVTDRCTTSHEYIFMFSKQAKYFYDQDSIRVELVPHAENNTPRKESKTTRYLSGDRDDRSRYELMKSNPSGRNRRSVWRIATRPYSSDDPDVDHFAAWPPALVELMIRAGTSEAGCCPICGTALVRVVEKEKRPANEAHIAALQAKGVLNRQSANLYAPHKPNPVTTLGFQPACPCPPHPPVPCLVADVFAGSGTSLLVARQLGRRAVGLDLSFAYLQKCAKPRLSLDTLENWTNGTATPAQPKRSKHKQPLYQELLI